VSTDQQKYFTGKNISRLVISLDTKKWLMDCTHKNVIDRNRHGFRPSISWVGFTIVLLIVLASTVNKGRREAFVFGSFVCPSVRPSVRPSINIYFA